MCTLICCQSRHKNTHWIACVNSHILICVHLVYSSNHSQLLIKSPKAKLHLILNARCDMSYENPVAQVYVQIEQNQVQSQSYYNLIREGAGTARLGDQVRIDVSFSFCSFP